MARAHQRRRTGAARRAFQPPTMAKRGGPADSRFSVHLQAWKSTQQRGGSFSRARLPVPLGRSRTMFSEPLAYSSALDRRPPDVRTG
jgi:hypothetical protein